MHPILTDLGWNAELQRSLPHSEHPDAPVARIVRQDRTGYVVAGAHGESPARLPGRLRHDAPAVGDWVQLREEPAGLGWTILATLPRRGAFVRKAAGDEARAQVVAANVDVALLVTGLDHDFNVRRIERALSLAHASGARPVVVLTKADLVPDAEAKRAEAERVAPGVPTLVVSARTGVGLDPVRALLAPGRTLVVLGSSGAGKSTLVNALAGREAMATAEVRDDGRGRHTTTSRQLLVLPGVGILLDTPGMRELGLWDAEAGVSRAFADVESLARQCRFRDCAHETEPGCAVRAALDAGELDEARWASWRKLQREMAHAARREDEAAQRAHAGHWRKIHRDQRARQRAREGKSRGWFE